MKNRNIIFAAILSGRWAALRFCQKRKRLSPPPDGCYPVFTTKRKAAKRFKASPPALRTQQLAGVRSLQLVTAASNTGVGAGALVLNTNNDNDTAVGAVALLLNTTGVSDNTAVGTAALVYNDTGSENTAVGAFALFDNTEGDFNAAGAFALQVDHRERTRPPATVRCSATLPAAATR